MSGKNRLNSITKDAVNEKTIKARTGGVERNRLIIENSLLIATRRPAKRKRAVSMVIYQSLVGKLNTLQGVD